MEGKKWTIQQLGGLRKKLELSGWAAPFGRERASTIVGDGIKLRVGETACSGNDEPVYHVGGVKYDDWELHGRWMDSANGPGFAKAMAANVKTFIAEAQRVSVSWGDVRVVAGLMDSLEPNWESEFACAWKLKIRVSRDVKLGTRPTIPSPRSAQSYTNRFIEQMSEPIAKAARFPPTMTGGFVDSLDSLVSFINAPGAALLNFSVQLDNLKNGTIGEIRRFRAGLQQYTTALTRFRGIYESAPSEFALEFQDTDEELRLMTTQAAFGTTMADVMRDIVKADQEAARAERSKIKGLAIAEQGDTWESISRRGYSGNAGRVKDILETNELSAGTQPIPGVTYILPT